MSKFYVYQIKHPETNRIFYVGKGSGNRCKQHLTDKKEYAFNKRLNGYIRNLIESNTLPIIKKIKENLTEEAAYELEETLIKKYGRKGIDENGILLNILESGRPPSFNGKDHPWYGRKHTEESKKKMRESIKMTYKNGRIPSMKGKRHSEESKEKNRQAHLGKKLSKENIEKLRLANIGKSQTDYQKQKAREANQKSWRIITPEGEELTIKNLRQFSLNNNLDQGNMVHVANGRQKHHKGYKVFRI